MNCSSLSSSTSAAVKRLLQKPLAFSSDASLIAASSRLAVPVQTAEGDTVLLNVEIFRSGDSTPTSNPILLLFIPGFCESAETKGVQAIVSRRAQPDAPVFQGIIAVLELEGHGLSSGRPCLCPSFDRLVDQVVKTVEFVVARKELFPEKQPVSVYLTGSSLGGALAIYAAKKLVHTTTTSSSFQLKGIAPVAPSVGMNPQMLPPSILVYGLKALACLAPNLQPSLTPHEDPSDYNCPTTTTRNFHGHWPLASSKMLLDVTSEKIPEDIAVGKLRLAHIPNVLVIAGETDNVVPLQAIETFYNAMESSNKDFLKVKKAGHDLLFRTKSSQQIVQTLLEWIAKSEGRL